MAEDNNRQRRSGYKVWEPLLLAIVTIIGMIAGTKLVTSNGQGQIFSREYGLRNTGAERISEMIRFIDAKYVDDVDSDILIAKAVQSIMEELDPHSSYISPEDLRDLEEKMQGSYDGIGIEFHKIRDTICVVYVFPSGPASKAGLRTGDKIVMVGDSVIAGKGIENQKIIATLKGEKGSRVEVGVLRDGVDSILMKSIERGSIPVNSIASGYMLDDKTGYIKLTRFSANAYREFMDRLEILVREHGMEHLVFDVRQNPGGYLKEAVNILSQFFEEKGKLLVYTEGENSKRMEYKSTGKPFFEIKNIAVLIDGGSASASEIIAGAIKDHDRGIVIGTSSFGKGLVQEQFALKNGGALRLTIARYYTPSGRLIQKPYINGKEPGDRTDTTAYYTTNGRKVYSEGGIKPDLTIPGDSLWNNKELEQIYDFMLEYTFYLYAQNPSGSALTVEDFVSGFASDEKTYDQFMRFASAKKDFPRSALSAGTRHQLRILIMANLATQYFGREAWYEVMNLEDPVVAKAHEVVLKDRSVTLKM